MISVAGVRWRIVFLFAASRCHYDALDEGWIVRLGSVRFENLKNFQICISNILRWRRLDEKQEETVFNKNVDLKTFSKVTNPPQKEISEFYFRIIQISFECLNDTENVD